MDVHIIRYERSLNPIQTTPISEMDDRALFRRFAADRVTAALKDTPVVMVIGPRQCGKTTLVRDLMAGERAYVTLDDDTVLEGARQDPVGFMRGLDRTTIDDVQRAPDLLRAIKRSVDQDRRPGRFLLTGSANVLTLPTVSDSLAGRMEIVTLLPLSRAELRGRRPAFLRKAFTGALVRPPEEMIGEDLVHAVLTGGYPEMLQREEPGRRQTWARDYVRAIIQRDVRDIVDVDRLDQMPRLLRVLAHRSGHLTNFTQIGGQNNLDDKTTKKYVAVLEQLFLVRRLEPWFRDRLKRLVKTPKLHFLDSGLLAAILGITAERIARDRALFGPLLESFIFSELLKQGGWLDEECSFSHYRDKDQDEVDLVIENEAAELVGIEVKAAATVNAGDFKGLRKMADATGDALRLGLVLYDGEQTVPFGDRLFALPVSCVWG
jgi:predicted AAA+ superfamily ATPase